MAADQSHVRRTRLLQRHQETRDPVRLADHPGRVQLPELSKRLGAAAAQRPCADDRHHAAHLSAHGPGYGRFVF